MTIACSEFQLIPSELTHGTWEFGNLRLVLDQTSRAKVADLGMASGLTPPWHVQAMVYPLAARAACRQAACAQLPVPVVPA